jgi:lipoate-protein ligase B
MKSGSTGVLLESPKLEILDLGSLDYQKAWELQGFYAAEIADRKRPPTLLLLEHPHIYTFGRSGRAENLLWDEDQLRQKNIAVQWVDRGGDVTYHGPGQLVGYPLIPVGSFATAGEPPGKSVDYILYLRRLEKLLIHALTRFGLVAAQRKGFTGVWIQADVWSRCIRCRPGDRQKPAKLAAIGIKVDARGISRHGFALNVDPDMSYWDGIVPCGLQDEPVAAMSDLLEPAPGMDAVKRMVAEAFEQEFFPPHS